jgi:hypothetical protein
MLKSQREEGIKCYELFLALGLKLRSMKALGGTQMDEAEM